MEQCVKNKNCGGVELARKAKDWFPNDKATHEWLDSMKKSSRHTYLTAWKYFLEYAGMTGDQILADRRKDTEYRWEKKVIEFKDWMIDVKKVAETTAATSAGAARSFFAYHRTELEFRRAESARLAEAKPKYEDYRFNKEDLAKMASVADLTEKYVLLAGKSFGLRAGDFLALARGDLEAYIDRPVPISIDAYSTQKESVPAYPFIDADAEPIIKLMLQKMEREGRTAADERILTYTDTIQLTRIVQRLTERAGIKIGNKRVRFHCLRKFLTDRLSSHMSESKWKQIVGKTISEGAYVSGDSLREDYERAMAETCFTEVVSAEEVELRVAKRLLEGQLKAAGLDPRRILRERAKMRRSALTTAEEVTALQEVLSKKQGPKGGGLPFEVQARKALADIVLGAIKDVKKKLADEN